jgi:hypothetical protein
VAHAALDEAREPASSEPPGAPRPLESATATRSKGAASSASGVPVAAATFQSRAPSRKVAISCARAAAPDAHGLVLREDHAAGAVVRVLDLHQRRRRVDHVAARVRRGEDVVGREHAARADLGSCTPAFAAEPPVSCQASALSRAMSTWSPGRVQDAQRHLVGHRAAREEERGLLAEQRGHAICSGLTVGSSPNWSSPTGAAAMAARIAGVGRVTVSERRSIGAAGMAREATPFRGAARACRVAAQAFTVKRLPSHACHARGRAGAPGTGRSGRGLIAIQRSAIQAPPTLRVEEALQPGSSCEDSAPSHRELSRSRMPSLSIIQARVPL